MSAARILCSMVAGTVLVMVFGARSGAKHQAKPPPPVAQERPWLTKEAAAQIVGPGGTPGPLFEGVMLGGPAPVQEIQTRIAAFARENRVQIDLDIVDGDVEAIRFGVTYDGGYGYEGADVLALRLERPSTGACCVCGSDSWINEWSVATDDGIHTTASVHVNRVEVRWEREMSLADMLDRAESLVGEKVTDVAKQAGARWTQLEHGRYLLRLPFGFGQLPPYVAEARWLEIVEITAEAGVIVEVEFPLHGLDARGESTLVLRARWGRPRRTREAWTWRKADRLITAELDGQRISIKRR